MNKNYAFVNKSIFLMPVLGVSLFASHLCATNLHMDVEEVSKKRAASDELVSKDEVLKKIKDNSEEIFLVKNKQKDEMIIKVREQAKKYNIFAQETSSAKKKMEAYMYASKLCDQILVEMGEGVAAFDVRNAAIAHYNLAMSLSDLNDKIMSLSRSAYLFNELIARSDNKSSFPDIRKGSIAHYQVSQNTSDPNMKSVYYARAVELYNQANEIEVDGFWNF